MSRAYGQFCGLARALDVVGERWTLLVVRELLVGSARCSELASGSSRLASPSGGRTPEAAPSSTP